MNRIVIIEDETPNVDRLKRLLKNINPDAEIVAAMDSIADSVEWFNTNDQPDLAIMDVRLSDGLSFDIFEKVQITCPIIFTTAYDEYAVRAFKYNSVDYLLKPVQPEELERAFTKLESITSPHLNPKALEGLVNFFKPKDYRNRFLLPYRDGYKSLLVADVACFYSELRIVRAKLNDGSEETLPQTMEELEQQLDPKSFFRANRQYIIHIDAIKQVHNYFNGKLKLDLKNSPDTEIIVSRDKATQLKNWLDY